MGKQFEVDYAASFAAYPTQRLKPFQSGRPGFTVIDAPQPPTIELAQTLSYRQGIPMTQARILTQLASCYGIFALLGPHFTVWLSLHLLWAGFVLVVGWRAFMLGLGYWLQFHRGSKPAGPSVDEDELPIYSVLIALHDEAAVVAQLAAALKALDWPEDRLDILLLIEAHDQETRGAIEAQTFPMGTRLVIVPEGTPQTKPRALNYGLGLARGSYVCVFDAEDRPDPQQLRQAYARFAALPKSCACLQAALTGANEHRAWLAANWTLDYATQFNHLLPAQAALGLPIAIGGTSNHFRRHALEAVGAWDPWNVTEDADLGLRFARAGYSIRALDSYTLEDAPETLEIWHNQRSRWIKGFMQTWLVLMRRPRRLLAELGFLRFVSVQLSLGGAILAPLFHGPMILLLGALYLSNHGALSQAGLLLLVFGWAINLIGDVMAPGRWSGARITAIILRPLYWPVHTGAAFRALWELAFRPYFWAKTPHLPHRG